MQTSALCRLGYEICSTWKQKDCDNFLSFNQLWSSYQIFQNCQIIPRAKRYDSTTFKYIFLLLEVAIYLESIIHFLSVIWPNIYFENCPNFKLCTYLFPNNQDAKIDTKSKFCIPTYLPNFCVQLLVENRGSFIYYVSTCREGGGGGQKMPFFAYS